MHEQVELAYKEGRSINPHQLNHLELQAQKHLMLLRDEERKLIAELPLSNFGPQRVPKHLTADIILGQIKKRKI